MRQALHPSTKRSPLHKQAFSLIEVLIAVTLLSVALLAYVSAISVARNAVDRGNFFMLASEAAATKIADLQGGGYVSLVNNTTNYTVSKLPGGKMAVTVGYLDGLSANGYIRQIDVVVTWTAGTGQTAQAGGSIKQSVLIAQRR